MAVPIPDSHMRLLTDPIVALVATIMPDGRPQVNPVWCDYDDTHFRPGCRGLQAGPPEGTHLR